MIVECDNCGETHETHPVTHQLTFLWPNARSNPASMAYRHDDCSFCADAKWHVCAECEPKRYQIAERIGMKWCASYPRANFPHLFEGGE